MRAKEIFYIIGFAVIISSYVSFIYAFLSAYFSPAKVTNVHINNFGEADVEFILFILTIPLVCYYTYKSLPKRGLNGRKT